MDSLSFFIGCIIGWLYGWKIQPKWDKFVDEMFKRWWP